MDVDADYRSDARPCLRGGDEWAAWDAEYSAWITDAEEEELVDLLGLTGRDMG